MERRSGTPVSACFQCHKCSTGCPIGPEMDLLSSQVMRLIHLGAEAEVLGSQAIWLCASCEACTTRCPMGIDIAGVMDTLRMMAVERKVALPDARGEQFNRSFLNSVRRHGRVFELGMMIAYKLRSRDFFADADKAPADAGEGQAVAAAQAQRQCRRGARGLPPGRRGGEEAVKYAFYPGCSLESTAWDFDESARAVCRALGIELEEIPDWVCCGSTPAHTSNASLAVALPVMNLLKAKAHGPAGDDRLCLVLRPAAHRQPRHPQRSRGARARRARRRQALRRQRRGSSPPGRAGQRLRGGAIRAKVQRPLRGLRVACYYGCLLTRPPEIVAFDNAEHPTCMDELLAAAGAEPVEWPFKTECCGAGLSITRSEVVERLAHRLLVDGPRGRRRMPGRRLPAVRDRISICGRRTPARPTARFPKRRSST